MANGAVRVQSGDVISATLMNYILEQLDEIQGGTPADLEQLRNRLQVLEAWRASAEQQVNRITGIDARLAAVETAAGNIAGLLADVNALGMNFSAVEQRVAELESRLQVAGKVRISGFDPPGQVPAGQVLTILGAGFKTPLVENLVFVNEVPIYNFRLDSDNSRLKIVIPTNIPGVTPVASGTPITIRVSNDDGESERPYAVTPTVTGTGAAPRISSIHEANGSALVLIHGHATTRINGVGFGNPTDMPIVRFVYMTDTGPVVYSFNSFISVLDHQIQLVAPMIMEAPMGGIFQALVEVDRGNHVSALALINMTREPQ